MTGRRSLSTKVLLRDSGVRLIAEMVVRTSSLLIIPVIIRGIEPGMFGVWASAVALLNLLVLVLPLRLPMAILRFAAGNDQMDHRDLTGITLISAAILLGLWAVVLAAPKLAGTVLFANAQWGWMSPLVVACVSVKVITDTWQAHLRAKGEVLYTSSLLIVERLAFLGIAVLLLGFSADRSVEQRFSLLLWALLASSVVSLLMYLVLYRRIPVLGRPRFTSAGAMIRYSAPLLVTAISAWLVRQFGVVAVLQQMGEQDAAIYGVAQRFAALPAGIMVICDFVLFPMMASAHNQSRPEDLTRLFQHSLRSLTILFVALAIPTIMLVKPLMRLLGSQSATPTAALMAVLCAGYFLQVLWYLYIKLLHLAMRTKLIMVISVLGGLLSVGLLAMFVSRWGSIGAAVAFVISMAFLSVAVIALGLRSIPISPPWRRMLPALWAAGMNVGLLMVLPTEGAWLIVSAVLGALVFLGAYCMLGGLSAPEKQRIIAKARALVRTKNGRQ